MLFRKLLVSDYYCLKHAFNKSCLDALRNILSFVATVWKLAANFSLSRDASASFSNALLLKVNYRVQTFNSHQQTWIQWNQVQPFTNVNTAHKTLLVGSYAIPMRLFAKIVLLKYLCEMLLQGSLADTHCDSKKRVATFFINFPTIPPVTVFCSLYLLMRSSQVFSSSLDLFHNEQTFLSSCFIAFTKNSWSDFLRPKFFIANL